METNPQKQARRRLPEWLKKSIPAGGQSASVLKLLDELDLPVVCVGAHCPNRAECFARGTATFMILGEKCTRNCRFCAVETVGEPSPLRADEPAAVAEAARRLDLRHVVITSVTRDDLQDGGAGHFARTIRAVRRVVPAATIEVLTPDFRGDGSSIEKVIAAGPDVFNHNVETVPRLYRPVRPQADFQRSLDVLTHAGRFAASDGLDKKLYTKSGLMVGLGETIEEVLDVFRRLRGVSCDMLTVGQYLSPSPEHLPVERFVPPVQFDDLKAAAQEMGFAAVASGPFIRSSYHAGKLFERRDRT